MKKNFLMIAIAIFTSVSFTACSDNDDNGNSNGSGTGTGTGSGDDTELAEGALPSSITEDVKLKKDGAYTLDGEVRVKSGATLTIPEGVVITAQYGIDNKDYLLIEQGAKIEAAGTKDNPVVMTSSEKVAGSWGGIHICGYAKLNDGSESVKKSEIGEATYGGTDDADNSGTLKYLRVEYAGQKFDATGEKEANGISFYGVGNGTTVEYVQTYRGTDDGFEWFGGSVNVKYLVSTSSSDDSFDWTGGWRGKGQFLVAYQEPKSENFNFYCDKMLECDNDKTITDKGASDNLSSFPTLANVTLVSENADPGKTGSESLAIRLRAGTEVKMYNVLLSNSVKENSICIETERTDASLDAGVSMLKNVYIDNGAYLMKSATLYTQDKFIASDNKLDFDLSGVLSGKFIGVVANVTGITADDFFEEANYVGAVPSNNNWTDGAWCLK